MNHFLRNTRAVLSNEFSAGAASGAVTVAAVNEAGVTVASGSAAQDGTNPALYTFQIPPQSQLMRGTATWSGTWGGSPQSVGTPWEVVGGHLFTVIEARKFRDGELADTTAFPESEIRAKRDQILDDFQNACGVPFVPRYEREIFDGTGRKRLWLPWKRPLALISVTVDGVALTAPELAEIDLHVTGRLEREAGWALGAQNVIVEWERGYRVLPPKIKDAALMLAQYELIASEITDRMVTVANELGTVRLSVPGPDRPTGIPIVDSALARYDEREKHMIAIRG